MVRDYDQIDDMLKYRCKACSAMTGEEIAATSELFSTHYGIWSGSYRDASKAGKHIRYTPKMIVEEYVNKPDRYVAMVFYDDELIGHAFYLRRKAKNVGYITWILQLVVNENFRGHHIGTKLMHSIWGLSDSFACGLYTSNPMTIRTLENATMRPVKVGLINKHIDKIRSVAYDLMHDTSWIDGYSRGMVNTSFWTDHSDLDEKIERYEISRRFPLTRKLPEGYEWLAFIFRRQELDLMTSEQIATYFSFSESILIDAYSKMKMKGQSWSLHTQQEVDYIDKNIAPTSDILDLGCGFGRHAEALARKGHNVVGVDFACVIPTSEEEQETSNPVFVKADARSYEGERRFDAVICLYDVIGSFPGNDDNLEILKTAYRCLKPGGKIFLSVMSLKYTEKICRRRDNVVDSEADGCRRIMRLKGSDTMQDTGNVFDGNLIVINRTNGVCYRKEQFFAENCLPTEYLIRDRRYTFNGICSLLHKAGFSISKKFGFNSGRMNEKQPPTEENAKELFVVAQKTKPIRAFIRRMFTSVDD